MVFDCGGVLTVNAYSDRRCGERWATTTFTYLFTLLNVLLINIVYNLRICVYYYITTHFTLTFIIITYYLFAYLHQHLLLITTIAIYIHTLHLLWIIYSVSFVLVYGRR